MPEVTVQSADGKKRRLPVVKDDVLYGIVTATDIMKYLGTGQVFDRMVTGNVAEVMALPVRTLVPGTLHTIDPKKNVNEAAREMLARNVGALPVIEWLRFQGARISSIRLYYDRLPWKEVLEEMIRRTGQAMA